MALATKLQPCMVERIIDGGCTDAGLFSSIHCIQMMTALEIEKFQISPLNMPAFRICWPEAQWLIGHHDFSASKLGGTNSIADCTT